MAIKLSLHRRSGDTQPEKPDNEDDKEMSIAFTPNNISFISPGENWRGYHGAKFSLTLMVIGIKTGLSCLPTNRPPKGDRSEGFYIKISILIDFSRFS